MMAQWDSCTHFSWGPPSGGIFRGPWKPWPGWPNGALREDAGWLPALLDRGSEPGPCAEGSCRRLSATLSRQGDPLLRMVPGDGLVYYSPRERFRESAPCQPFVAIGRITGSEVYPIDMGGGFVPFRRDAAYVRGAVEAPVQPLLTFVRDPAHWGAVFRFGFLEIASSDFSRIARAMEVYDERV